MTGQSQEKLTELLEELKRHRDELKVQMRLGKAEAEDLWHETEEKWRHLRGELDKMESDTGDTAKDVGAAAILLAEEIKHGYERLRKKFEGIER